MCLHSLKAGPELSRQLGTATACTPEGGGVNKEGFFLLESRLHFR